MAPTEMISEKRIECDVTASLNGCKRAYVTFLAGNLDYWMGVVGLAKGLRKVKSAYPLVVAILPDVPEDHREILVAQGYIVLEIVPVHPPENKAGYAMAYYVINYSKLRIWEGSKPWRYTGDEEHMDRDNIKMLVKKWWDIYQDSSLDYQNYVKNEPKLNSIIIDSLASKVSGAVTSLAPSAA